MLNLKTTREKPLQAQEDEIVAMEFVILCKFIEDEVTSSAERRVRKKTQLRRLKRNS